MYHDDPAGSQRESERYPEPRPLAFDISESYGRTYCRADEVSLTAQPESEQLA